jgi:thermitase
MFKSIRLIAIAATMAVGVAAFAQYGGGGFYVGNTVVSQPQVPFVRGQVLVKFTGTSAQANTALRAINAREVDRVNRVGVSVVSIPSSMSVQAAVNHFSRQPGVEFAEPNYIARTTFVPNDPRFRDMYGMGRIQMSQAWDIERGNANIIIAILDTGVDGQHPDLVNKMVPGRNFTGGNDDDWGDRQGHGTHVAGSAAAHTNNGIGVVGVGFECMIMPVKVLGDSGGGAASWIANGITWAADNGAHVINMSLGMGAPSSTIRQAMQYALTKGSLPIAAAGNNGNTARFWPAADPESLSVAATDSNDNRAGFSTHGDWVDVAAPGAGILSTLPGNRYGINSGTSMAAPHVAGLAGLVYSRLGANATPAAVRSRIETTTDYVGTFIIHGRVNAFKAVQTGGTVPPPAGGVVPTSIKMFEGASASGVLADVVASDNQHYRINSTNIVRTGQVSSAEMTFTSPRTASQVTGMTLRFESHGVAGSTGSAFLWDWSRNTYVYVGAAPLTSTDTIATIRVNGPFARFVNNSRQVRAVIRSVNPSGWDRNPLPYQYRIDHVVLDVR